jgi:4-hydroxybenzoyl-CoA thioesterase/acyl-CoA thioester hydrolase
MAGIVHFSRFFVFMENCELEYLDSLGFGLTTARVDLQGLRIGWPRVAASCEYLRPVRFGEEIEVGLEVKRKGKKSLTFCHEIRSGAVIVARGETSAVCCAVHDGGILQAIPIPPALAALIDQTGPVTA